MAFRLFSRGTRAVEVSPVRAKALADQIHRYIAERLPHCPLTALGRRQFAEDEQATRLAEQRCQIFLWWCARRTIQAFCRQHHKHIHLIEASERAFRRFIDDRCEGAAQPARELLAEAHSTFERFDAAMGRNGRPGPAHWLGRAVLDYVTDGQFNPHGPNDMMLFGLPAEIMRGVDQNITALLNRPHV